MYLKKLPAILTKKFESFFHNSIQKLSRNDLRNPYVFQNDILPANKLLHLTNMLIAAMYD